MPACLMHMAQLESLEVDLAVLDLAETEMELVEGVAALAAEALPESPKDLSAKVGCESR